MNGREKTPQDLKIVFGSSFAFGFLRPETDRLGSRQAIITDINAVGFPIVASELVSLTPQAIEYVYKGWWGEPNRDKRLVDYLRTAPVLAFLARDTLSYVQMTQDGQIIENNYSFKGPERFRWVCGAVGEKTMGAGIRGKYGISGLETAVHRSDSEKDALRECLVIAPNLIRNTLSGNFERFRLDEQVIEANLKYIGIPEANFDGDEFWSSTSDAMQSFLIRNYFYDGDNK